MSSFIRIPFYLLDCTVKQHGKACGAPARAAYVHVQDGEPQFHWVCEYHDVDVTDWKPQRHAVNLNGWLERLILRGLMVELGVGRDGNQPIEGMPPADAWLEDYLEQARPTREKEERRQRALEVARRIREREEEGDAPGAPQG